MGATTQADSMSDPNVPANVRLRLSQREALDGLVEDGKIDSRTDGVQIAVEALLDNPEEFLEDT